MNNASPVETYEELFARLQEIVTRLETGELPLAETLKLYQQGTQLAAACQQLLDNAELQVRQIAADEVED